MPIQPIGLFSSDTSQVRDLSGFSSGDLFNQHVFPRAQSLMGSQELDLQEEPELTDPDPLSFDLGTADTDVFASALSAALKGPSTQTLVGAGPGSTSQSPQGEISPSGLPSSDLQAPESGSDLTSFVKQFEGFNPKAFSDYKQTSIGYGTRAKSGETRISRVEAERRLGQELASHRNRVESHLQKHGMKLSPRQVDALVSFDYNTGSIDQLTAGGSRSPQEIASKILEYNKAGGKVLRGLVRRRKAEHEMFVSGFPKTPTKNQ